MKLLNKFLPFIIVFFYILIYSAILADSYKNPNKFFEKTFIDPVWMLFLLLFINLLMRLQDSIEFPKAFLKANKYIIFPISLITTIFFTVWSYYSPSNFVYSKFPINFQETFFLALGSGLVILINTHQRWLKKNLNKLLLLTPVIILLMGLLIRLWPFDVFLIITKEDHLIENLQFLSLSIATILAFLISYYLSKIKNTVPTIIFLLVGVGLFLVAGDEISWGQRLLGVETPESLATQNSQQEITFHNLYFFNLITRWLYIFVGLYGSISWIFSKYLKHLAIPKSLALFFLPIFIYNLIAVPETDHSFGEWSEVTELLMYLGIALTFQLKINTLKVDAT